MQRKDYIVLSLVVAGFGWLVLAPGAMDAFISLTGRYPYAMSFVKFAILATLGECIALRITTGVYNRPGFGIAPKFFVWGLLGMACKLNFTLFSTGTPAALTEMGLLAKTFGLEMDFGTRLTIAFFTSVFINVIFAPVLMITHKLTDNHITATGGTLQGLFSMPRPAELFQRIDWTSMWGFILKKTIPLFWIPAHTVTFLLPGYFQVLFAALLSIALGIILAFAGLQANKQIMGSSQ